MNHDLDADATQESFINEFRYLSNRSWSVSFSSGSTHEKLCGIPSNSIPTNTNI